MIQQLIKRLEWSYQERDDDLFFTTLDQIKDKLDREDNSSIQNVGFRDFYESISFRGRNLGVTEFVDRMDSAVVGIAHRRSGKTTYGIISALFNCTTYNDTSVLVLVPFQVGVEAWIDAASIMISETYHLRNAVKSITRSRITFYNGSSISVKSGSSRSIDPSAGMTYDQLIVNDPGYYDIKHVSNAYLNLNVLREPEKQRVRHPFLVLGDGATYRHISFFHLFPTITYSIYENKDWNNDKILALKRQCYPKEWEMEYECSFTKEYDN